MLTWLLIFMMKIWYNLEHAYKTDPERVERLQISTKELIGAAFDARIELTVTEIEKLQKEIQNLFDLFKPLQTIDLTGVAAACYGHRGPNLLREDLACPSLPREASLANAPVTDESCFLVPRIIEE